MTTFSTVESLLQIALENKQAMDEAMRSADRSHQAKRRFAETPAEPSAFGHLNGASGEAVQRPDGKTERCFACGRPVGLNPELVDTRDAQFVFVGRDCYRRVIAAGDKGYQPPKGGPRLFPMYACEFPDRDACEIDDERDQGPLFDAPGHPGARYTWGGR